MTFSLGSGDHPCLALLNRVGDALAPGQISKEANLMLKSFQLQMPGQMPGQVSVDFGPEIGLPLPLVPMYFRRDRPLHYPGQDFRDGAPTSTTSSDIRLAYRDISVSGSEDLGRIQLGSLHGGTLVFDIPGPNRTAGVSVRRSPLSGMPLPAQPGSQEPPVSRSPMQGAGPRKVRFIPRDSDGVWSLWCPDNTELS